MTHLSIPMSDVRRGLCSFTPAIRDLGEVRWKLRADAAADVQINA
jgi:hypothetical protein